MGVTKDLSKFLAELKYDYLPKDVTEKTKRLILDYLGYSIIAINEPPAKILYQLILDQGKPPEESTIIGYGKKTSCLNATLINSAMGHMCEMDDTHRLTGSHPGDSIIPSALAIAEKVSADGKEFITAVVAGYEAALRIGAGVCPAHYLKGWHTSGTICTFGAAAAAGKIFNFNVDEMENTLGLAGVQVGGIFGDAPSEKSEVTFMTKDLRPGKAGWNGVFSALLTSKGFTGNKGILENERGFCALYSDKYNLNKITENMGHHFKVMEVAHKPYSACRFIHPAIDATLGLVDKYKITSEMVDEIIAESYNYVALGMDNMNPIVPYGPRFSIQFQIALSLLEGREGLKKIMVNDAYASKKLQEPLFRSTMNKVKTLYNKEMDKEWSEDCLYSAKVKIKLLNGKLYESYIAYPKGEPENDMTKEELEEKYIMLATKIIPIDTAKLILNKVEQLETLTDINALSNLFIKQ